MHPELPIASTRSRRGRRSAAAEPAAPATAAAALNLDVTIVSMTIREAARVTGFSRDALYFLIAADEIRSFRMASRRYIDAASLRAYVARRAAEPVSLRPSPRTRDGRQDGAGILAGLKPQDTAEVRKSAGPPESIVHAGGAKK